MNVRLPGQLVRGAFSFELDDYSLISPLAGSGTSFSPEEIPSESVGEFEYDEDSIGVGAISEWFPDGNKSDF